MTAFNFDPGADIFVDTDGDDVTIRFDGDTFALNPTTNGFSATNDWNNRHFTLGFDKNSVLYHVTREDEDDRRSGKQSISHEEFIAEMYGYIRSIAKPIPEDELPFDIVGRVDVQAMEDYLRDKNVVRETDSGIQIDDESRAELIESLNEDPGTVGTMFERVLTPVPFDEATNPESGENIFVYPTQDDILLLFMFPGDYVGVTNVVQVFKFAEYARGSQIIDHILRAMGD